MSTPNNIRDSDYDYPEYPENTDDKYPDDNNVDDTILPNYEDVELFWNTRNWNFLYSSIYGTYPIRINKDNWEHKRIKRQFKTFLFQLKYILPCKNCKELFKILWEKIPIDDYLDSRNKLLNWLYKIQIRVDRIYIASKQLEKCNKYKQKLKNDLENNYISKSNYEKNKKLIINKYKKIKI